VYLNGVNHVDRLLGAAASRLRGAGSPCGKGLGGALEKGLWAYNTAQRVSTIQEKMQSGDIVGAVLDTVEAAVGVRRMLQACFVAGTPLRGEFGARPIESFRVGDRIWSRDEHDPQGADGLQVVEEVFVRLGRVLWLTVNGQRIGTTSEHPFFSPVHGWCNAGDLSVGASVLLRDGSYGLIEAMEAGEYATVYNLRVSDWHTYFVGEDGWGFEVWAHNADYGVRSQHWQTSSEGSKLRSFAHNYRQKLGVQDGQNPNRNVLVAKVVINGKEKLIPFINTPKSDMHSENKLIGWYDRMKSKGLDVEVKSVYTERTPCGPGQANCKSNLAFSFGNELPVYHSTTTKGPLNNRIMEGG
jgi:Pretoxin HINT domain/Xanthomonas XOO_2897-like deaminase